MHELSIALSIIDVASEEAEGRGARVLAVRLRLGPLSGVVKEALLSAFASAREGSPLEGARLEIEEVPIVAHCPTCREDRVLPGPQEIFCPVCGTPTPDLVGGRELEVTALEIVEHEGS
jgi:hydrogenase nickel incorporation protein HypA/HybF